MASILEDIRAAVAKRLLPKPCLILILGVAGSGKSTLSREILRHLWAVYLDNNHIANAFFPKTRHGRDYRRLRPRFYKALYTITEENLKLGHTVLLDVPHVKEVQRPEWRDFVRRLVKRTQTQMIAIRCLCSERVLYARIRLRGEQRDRWKVENWKKFLRKEPIEVPIPFPHLDIDTEKGLSKNSSTALRYIQSQAQKLSK